MDPTQRTGTFTAATHLQPGAETEQLKALFHRIGTHLQKATDDGRDYTFEVKIVTYVTVDPRQAEIGEHVHRDHFVLNPIPPDQQENQHLEVQSPSGIIQKYVFQPTRLGFQRIE